MSISKVVPRTIPSQQQANARELRSHATPAERKLWSRLRASSLEGHKFSRQIAVGSFICDLVCRNSRLIVEVDGSQHGSASGGEGDARRTRYLEAEGYTVLRFWNAQVLQDVDSVLVTILAAVRDRATRAETPPPAPPASGRGAE